MAKAYAKCKCGGEILVIDRNRKSADSKAAWMEGKGFKCDACQAKERAEESAEAAKQAAESGLPTLEGTEKQIAWAETIRQRKMEHLDIVLSGRCPDGTQLRDDDPLVGPAISALKGQTKAEWWIDHRGMHIYDLLVMIAKKVEPEPQDRAAADSAEAEAKAEATVYPENPVSSAVAEIRVVGSVVEVVMPERNEEFRQLVRFGLGFKWSGNTWRRQITETAGTPQDRAAEAGHRIMLAGFPIRIYSAELRQAAIDGNYNPERKRWVKLIVSGDHPGWLMIQWPRSDDLYHAAKRITGAKYSRPYIVTPPESFQEVLDFAETYDFGLSRGAVEVIESQKRIKDKALRVSVTEKSPEPPMIDTGKPITLNPDEVDQDIDDDLRD